VTPEAAAVPTCSATSLIPSPLMPGRTLNKGWSLELRAASYQNPSAEGELRERGALGAGWVPHPISVAIRKREAITMLGLSASSWESFSCLRTDITGTFQHLKGADEFPSMWYASLGHLEWSFPCKRQCFYARVS
jgi:hypothetical protein